MKYRLLDFLICPACGRKHLSMKVFKETRVTPLNNSSRSCATWCGRQTKDIGAGMSLRYEAADFKLKGGWTVWPDNPDFIINQREKQAIAETEIEIPETGIYKISVLGIPGNKVGLAIDGLMIGEVSRKTDSLRFRSLLGETKLDKGRHSLAVTDSGGTEVSYITCVFIEQVVGEQAVSQHDCDECAAIDVDDAVIVCECGRWFPVIEAIPFMLPDSCRDQADDLEFYERYKESFPPGVKAPAVIKKDKTVTNDPDRYKRAEIAISDNPLSDVFFESQRDLPFDPRLPSRTLDFISRYVTAVGLLGCGVGDTVLDNGVGTAWTSQWLARLGYEVIATEICVDYLRSGIRRMGREFVASHPLHMVVADAENLPFRDDIVEGVLSFDSFHHMLDRKAVVSGFDRVLRSGGKTVFVEPGADHEQQPVSVWVNQRYGILERGVTLEQLKKYAKGTAFTEFVFRRFDSHNCDVLVLRRKGVREYLSSHPDQIKADLKVTDIPRKVRAGEPFNVTLNAVNIGNTRWLPVAALGCGQVVSTVDLYDKDVDLIAERFAVAALPREVSPGDSIDIVFSIMAPQQGSYLLQFDMCVEGLMSFKDYEFKPLNIQLRVT